jgi:hypothetical protein
MAFGQSEGILNKLLAPGLLIKGHIDLEKKDCLKCHDAGKGVPDEKCLACHKPIQKFVTGKTGFHGLSGKSCFECHIEHKGRDFNTIGVDEKAFDHAKMTGYSLEGKHHELKCTDCHKGIYDSKSVLAGHTRYFGNQATCISCHKKDDPHFFKGEWAKKDCITCHSLKSWKEETQFNHEKQAHFKLEGRHAELKCADCHGPNKKMVHSQYKWPELEKNQCLTCHQDFHKNNLSSKFKGGKCITCHTQDNWKIEQFQHQVTGYNLKGKHFEIDCIKCHTQTKTVAADDLKHFNFTGLRPVCLTCHKDYHLFEKAKFKHFSNPNKCEQCHVESSWNKVQNFDHNRDTRFVIDGKHDELSCLDCHVQDSKTKAKLPKPIYNWPHLMGKTCETCHASPHKNQFSAQLLKKTCTECHVTTGWYNMKNGKGFDHSKTRFPLTGAHAHADCNECHGSQGKKVFKFNSPELKFCVSCHQDIHKNQFSDKMKTQNCTQCHTTEDFVNRLKFDHSTTSYPLEGAHGNVKCEECHKPTAQTIQLTKPNTHRIDKKTWPEKEDFKISQFKFTSFKKEECLTCHVDYHQGQLGNKCLDCHTIQSWKKPHFVHNKQSSFVISGKHEEVKCAKCHLPIKNAMVSYKGNQVRVIRFKPISSQCITCHQDAHAGAFGNKCSSCHVDRGWKVTKDFHKNFTLSGVHFSLSCNECHSNGRKLSGMSEHCIVCHAKDDVHSGTLPHCQDCHRQQFWEVASFKHSLTNFPLLGAHRTLDCMECHRSGTYKGLSSRCSSCHLSDALAVSSPVHSGFANLNSCNDCHLNQFAW